MDYETQVIEAFPELDEIDDEGLREKVVACWVYALEASDFEVLADVKRSWTDPEELDHAKLVDHIREATACAMALYETLTELHDHDLDRDGILAASLVHDASKLLEMSDSLGNFNDLIPHPHYAVHLMAEVGFPVELQHVVLCHSTNTAVEPETFEARIVEIGDRIATDSLWWAEVGLGKWHKRGV